MKADAPEKLYRTSGAGILLRVRLTPKSSKDAIDGVRELDGRPALTARVRAVPEKGKANAALEGLLAKWLGVAKRDVGVISGHTSRLKTVRIAGDAAATGAAVDARVEEFG